MFTPILQYKFIVDGDCRHDDQQPIMTLTFGTINNFLYVTTPELPTMVVTESLGMESQMEVDCAFQHVSWKRYVMHFLCWGLAVEFWNEHQIWLFWRLCLDNEVR